MTNGSEIARLRHNGRWCSKLGIALILLGVLAITSIEVANVNSVILIGWLMVVSGVTEAVHAFHLRRSSAFFFHLIPAIAGLPIGVLMVTHPASGATAWMLVFASSFMVTGGSRVISAFQLKFPSWKWSAFDGGVTLLLSALFWTTWCGWSPGFSA